MSRSGGPRHPDRPLWRVAACQLSSLAGLGGLAGFLVGLGGRHLWICELLTHFRVHYALLLLLAGCVLAVCGAWKRAAAAMCAVLVIGATLTPLYFAPREPSPAVTWRLLSANLFVGNQTPEEFVTLVTQIRPDVVVCLEVTPSWGILLSRLQPDYPYQRIEARDGAFGVAVLSRFPWESVRVEQKIPGHPLIVASIQVASDDVPTLIAVHPVPPVAPHWTALRNRQLQQIAQLTDECQRPLILAGDLNATSWSPAFSDLVNATGLRDSRRGFGVQASWPSHLGPFGIPIDHVLVSPEMTVVDRRVGPDFGADHRPIIVDLGTRTSVVRKRVENQE